VIKTPKTKKLPRWVMHYVFGVGIITNLLMFYFFNNL